MEEITLAELVRNGTLSAPAAATLWRAAELRKSFVVVAIPRFAGKSTLTRAVLSLLPEGVPVHHLNGDQAQMAALRRAALGGYLVVGEFSQAPVPGYIWGEPVRRVFETMTAGYSLATALHAPGVREAIQAICEGNGVSDEAASLIDLVVYVRLFGQDEDSFWRRVAEVYEVDRVVGGAPQGRTLFRWREDGDTFEQVAAPRFAGGDGDAIDARASALRDLAASGRTSGEDMTRLRAELGS